MRKPHRFVPLLLTIHVGVVACSDNTVTSPTAVRSARLAGAESSVSGGSLLGPGEELFRSVILDFTAVGPEGPPVTIYSEAGFVVSMTTGNWTANDYGNPGPSIQFESPAGVTTEGAIAVRADDTTPFRMTSVDMYSSITQIPYVITGTLLGQTVFREAGQLGYTTGKFVRVDNPHGDTFVDTIVVHLTNPAFSCCSNPMGLDNITLRR
jgi:hypothetical protein